MSKPKVAFYWCASCGGCEEAVVDLGEDILKVVEAVDILFWPVALDFKRKDVEALQDGELAATFINGAVRSTEQEEMTELLRKKSGQLWIPPLFPNRRLKRLNIHWTNIILMKLAIGAQWLWLFRSGMTGRSDSSPQSRQAEKNSFMSFIMNDLIIRARINILPFIWMANGILSIRADKGFLLGKRGFMNCSGPGYNGKRKCIKIYTPPSAGFFVILGLCKSEKH